MSKPEPNLEARTFLLARIAAAVRSWGISQPAAAQRLGTSQPRVNVLLKERVELFSLCNLIELTQKAGLALTLTLDGAGVQLERIELPPLPPTAAKPAAVETVAAPKKAEGASVAANGGKARPAAKPKGPPTGKARGRGVGAVV